MARLFWLTVMAAFVAALLLGASWAVAYSTVADVLGSPPPEMGRQSTTLLWQGAPELPGHPRLWRFAFAPTRLPGAPTVPTYAPSPPAAGSRAPVAARVTAGRAQRAPVIDGRDDDEVWRQAPVITEFRQWQPVEDGEPRFRTEAKVAYDTRNFYVFVRAFDPRPDSILKPLSRRDVFSASDRIWVMIDSSHDRRTGYEFGVNPVGAKLGLAISNDGHEDDAWDAVWDVATTLDSLGWTAEFRIPLSQ